MYSSSTIKPKRASSGLRTDPEAERIGPLRPRYFYASWHVACDPTQLPVASTGFHFDRTARRYRHHCDSGGTVVASVESREGTDENHPMLEQPATDRGGN